MSTASVFSIPFSTDIGEISDRRGIPFLFDYRIGSSSFLSTHAETTENRISRIHRVPLRGTRGITAILVAMMNVWNVRSH